MTAGRRSGTVDSPEQSSTSRIQSQDSHTARAEGRPACRLCAPNPGELG